MKKEVNNYINKALGMLNDLQFNDFENIRRVQQELEEDKELFYLGEYITMTLLPEYLRIIPFSSKERDEYVIYLELLRQLMLEEVK